MIPWAGECTGCHRAIQSEDVEGPWLDDDGRSECHGTTERHQPAVPPAYTSVTADDWVVTG